jgi:ubiquitin C-terminal hydrolase
MLKQSYDKEYSEFMELFYGIYVSRITSLTDQVHSLKPESFFILDLPLSTEPSQTIDQCLDRYVETEILERENAWYNENTKTTESAKKNIVFWNFPKILVIMFKRFSADGQQKNGAHITFPIESLDLSKYVAGYNAKSYVYDLIGICNHMGNVAGGHYTAFSKIDNTWYHCNDTQVDIVANPSQMVTPAAYCIFYRKKNKVV